MAFRLRNYIVALLIFGTVTTGLLGFAGNIFDVYGTQTNTSILEQTAEDTFEQTNRTVQQSQSNAEGIGGGIAEGLFILKSVWNVLALSLGSVSTVTMFTTTMSNYLGIPAWFVSLVTGVVVVYVVYELITLYRGIRS